MHSYFSPARFLLCHVQRLIRLLWLATAPVGMIHMCPSVPQELLRSSQGLSEEREEVRRRLTEATDRVRQLEEDLLGVSQRGLQKETELDWWAWNAYTCPSITQGHLCEDLWVTVKITVFKEDFLPAFCFHNIFIIPPVSTTLNQKRIRPGSVTSCISCFQTCTVVRASST